MSDYNPDQQQISLGQIADEKHHSSLLPDDQQESQLETPSFCELVLAGQFDLFQYSHVKDTTEMKYSAAENFLVRKKSFLAMAIGHKKFHLLIKQKTF
jgi:hypothetical protein